MYVTLNANAAPRAGCDMVRFGGDLLKKVLTSKFPWFSRLSLMVTARLFLLALDRSALAIARARRFVSRATERDRPQLLMLARRLGAIVTTLDDSRQELEQAGIARSLPANSRLILRRLSELAEEADDIAENAALGASANFAEFVHQELTTVGIGETTVRRGDIHATDKGQRLQQRL